MLRRPHLLFMNRLFSAALQLVGEQPCVQLAAHQLPPVCVHAARLAGTLDGVKSLHK